MARATEALGGGQVGLAPAHQQAAADQLKQLSTALRKAVGTAVKAEQLAAARDQIGQLAGRQGQLAGEHVQLVKARVELVHQFRAAELAQLLVEQAQLAAGAAELADGLKRHSPQPDRADTAAARAAADAQKALAQADAAAAATKATLAADTLAKIARRLGADTERPGAVPPMSPASRPAVTVEGATAQEPEQVLARLPADRAHEIARLVERSAELAHRQKRTAEALSSLAGDDLLGAVRIHQQQVCRRTGDLVAKTELLTDHAVAMVPDQAAGSAAKAAGEHVAGAIARQRQADGKLAARGAGSAVGEQNQAAALLGKAAVSLAELGKKVAYAAAGAPPPPAEEGATPDGLAAAYAALARAARGQRLSDAERAAELLAALSAQARQQMQVMGLAEGFTDADAAGGWTVQSMGRFGQMLSDLSWVRLGSLGVAPEEWARLPGHLRDQVLQAAGDARPQEYRQLIKLYFQEVSRRAAADRVQELKP